MRRAELVEVLADISEPVMMRVLEDEEPTVDELRAAVRQGTLSGAFFPVLAGSALRNAGVQPLLDAIVAYLPTPLEAQPIVGHAPDHPEVVVTRQPDPDEPLCALAFKIVTDPHGDLTFARIYSGHAQAGPGPLQPPSQRPRAAPCASCACTPTSGRPLETASGRATSWRWSA